MDMITNTQLEILNKELLNRVYPNSHKKMDIPQRVESVKQLELLLKEKPETSISVVYNHYGYSSLPINVVEAYFDENDARQMILESEKLKQNMCYYLVTGSIKDFDEGNITHKNTKIKIMEGLNRTTIYMSLMEKVL